MAGNWNVNALLTLMSPNSAALTLCLVLSWAWRPTLSHVVGHRNGHRDRDAMGPRNPAAAAVQLDPQDDDDTRPPTITDQNDVDAQSEEEVLRMIRLEMIKTKMLQKLGMDVPPPVVAGTIPDPVQEAISFGRDVGEDWEMVNDGGHHHPHHPHRHHNSNSGNNFEPRQVILLAEEVRDCPENQQGTCIKFALDEKLYSYKVNSTKLWFYVKSSHPIVTHSQHARTETFELAERTRQGSKKCLEEVQVPAREGWVQIDIRKAVLHRWLTRMLSNGAQHTDMEVSCRTCADGEVHLSVARADRLKPFLVVNMQHTAEDEDPDVHSRERRSYRRSHPPIPSSCCQLDQFMVNFTEIGFDFVIMPETHDAGHCKGSCSTPVCLPQPQGILQSRQQLLDAYRGLHPRSNIRIDSCCAPSKKKGASMVYWTRANEITHRVVPDMAVTECECVF